MAGRIETRLTELGIVLPQAPSPAANYVPWATSGKLVFIAGQIPFVEGQLRFAGRLGTDFGIEEGRQAARICGLNMLAQLHAATADLDRIVRCVRLGGFVACTPEFTDHPKVINGASDLMVEVFGDAGRHARAAVGCPSLPLGAAVEVEGIFEIR